MNRICLLACFFTYFKDDHDEFRFLELRRLFRIGKIVGKSICRDNDLLIFMTCKRLIRITFGGNKSIETDIEMVRFLLKINNLILL